MREYLEFNDELSSKFWEISLTNDLVITRWGSIGTKSQQKIQQFSTNAAAEDHYKKTLALKIRKGYIAAQADSDKTQQQKSLEWALDNGPRRKRMPADFTAAFRRWIQIKGMLSESALNSDDIHNINKGFQRASWGWKPVGKIKNFSEINRLGENLCGPPYTCKGYEWPISSSGCPYLPFVQIDLRKASKICDVDIGDGFVQVFYNGFDELSGYSLRIIPRRFISKEKMLPIPNWTKSQLKALDRSEFFFGHEELDANYECLQVTGYSRKAFSMPYGLCWLALEDLDASSVGVKNRQIRKFEEKLELLQEEIISLEQKYHGETQLFGSFHGIQFEPEECAVPLFCIDGNPVDKKEYGYFPFFEMFELGDAGNGQVFIEETNDGSIDFSFLWSCH